MVRPDILNGLATVVVLGGLLFGLLGFFFIFGSRH